jgi:glycosyltransferase involved in cell wall biosynthesis
VRIGIDMLGVQSSASRGRGIGRYARSLAGALLRRGGDHEFVLYGHHGLPVDGFPRSANARVRVLDASHPAPEAIERIASFNPDRLDALLILSPFELHEEYRPPSRPLAGLRIAAVIYDLLPFLFPERYLTYPPAAAWFYRSLERLRAYDHLLAISVATTADAQRLLGLDARRVRSIGTASDPTFFYPDRALPLPPWPREAFGCLGIDRPFVFTVAGTDERKNLAGLLDAFALLPPDLRRRHQLVVTCALEGPEAERVRDWAARRGLDDRLVLTGELPDDTLRLLYQRCAVFAFPSRYEGFGLPILEAMHCGAAVVAGNNSSQVEVLGDAGLLANAADPADIAAKLRRLLEDDALAEACRVRGLARGSLFRWESVANRALDAIAERPASPLRRKESARSRARLAVFSPWPPKTSGVSDYAMRLVRALGEYYRIDLYHDPGYEPDLDRGESSFRACKPAMFARNDAVLGYRGVLYQMGNSHHHGFIYEALRADPGLVTLHDFNLASFHCWRANRRPDPIAALRDEIRHCEGPRGEAFVPLVRDTVDVARGVESVLVANGVSLNSRVIAAARPLVVHSGWAWRQVGRVDAGAQARCFVIPHGADPVRVPAGRRAEVRAAWSIPHDALVFASFGILHAQKMNVEALQGFAPVAASDPSALFLFVGPDHGEGAARREAQRLGIEHRVRFFGRRSDAEFLDLVAATDVGVALRRPPTYGETSGALLHLLRHGVASVVIDADAFSDFPDDVVEKVRWECDGTEGIARAMLTLARAPSEREALGRRALDHIERWHAWRRVASRYAELIERFRRQAPARPGQVA